MTHLLLGIDVTSLGQSPYVPSVCADVELRARELGAGDLAGGAGFGAAERGGVCRIGPGRCAAGERVGG